MNNGRMKRAASNSPTPPAGPSLPRLPTFRFFCHGNDRPGRFQRLFFQSTPFPRPATGCSANFSLSPLELQMIDQNTNLLYRENKTMRKKRFPAFFFTWNFVKISVKNCSSLPMNKFHLVSLSKE